ncbi:MAG: SDR family oxidoreductase [Chloroflexi bacterium]|nr:SDR family oxidoreductase [Chloroflexota bacterium]MCI0577116.1 SDR family oxidoreductase [Chloroflexota bacterium]MCI0646841.1 SDR family oxidoreductase [Chloroflexota bacterium]MCI0728810.1 SDR family oxidoreductase [Chloroflexota bacterium]
MLLKDKNAVIYGAGGAIGSAVARAFARDGAKVFLAGRTQPQLEALAEEISVAGGAAEAAQVDALDPQAIEEHLDAILKKAGRIDISFNAIWIRGDLQGTPLIQMPSEDFTLPILTGVKTHFLTATAAARHMVRKKSGVILTLSSSSAGLSGRDRRYHLTGGFGTACAAIEALSRSLAGELGPQGIRVVCLRPDAIPETWSAGADEVRTYMENGTVLGRLPTLDEVANAAVFMASDRASAMTGTIANLTCGSIMDMD